MTAIDTSAPDPPCTYFASTGRGMEYLLAAELRALGVNALRERFGGVAFTGPLRLGYVACLWSRIASRVLLSLARFAAPTPDELYAGIRAIDWAEHLAADGSLVVDFDTRRSQITHSHFGAQKVKDAIVDQFRAATGTRPSVRLDRPDLRIRVFLDRDEAQVYVDLSGESLHRRGYRLQTGAAPLKENLAAAILARAGWPAVASAGGAFVDPMCGAGTLPIEAALMAGDVAPGSLRDYFGFLGWRQHDAAVWDELKRMAEARRAAGLVRCGSIAGFDHDRQAVAAAIANVARAGLAGVVHIERRAVADLAARAAPGLVAVNPPYGQRLGDERGLAALYTELGEVLRARFAGWKAVVLTGNPELGFRLGLRSQRPHTFYNGAIECRLLEFEVDPARWLAPRPPAVVPAEDRRASIMAAARGPGVAEGDVHMFANRLRKNLDHLGRWAARQGIDCYRLYDADLPEYAVAIDLYRGARLHVHVQEYHAPASVAPARADARLTATIATTMAVLGVPIGDVHLKIRERQKGRAQYDRQAEGGEFHVVTEGACRFWVNLSDYLDTGLFLDHRLVRETIAGLAAGRRFLNLFGYTGAATVCAARAGARATTTVDLSRTYLDWARRNLALNGLDDARHELVQADCLAWIEAAAGEPANGRVYDLILLNPPTFSNSKRMDGVFDVRRDHAALITRSAALLAPGGTLIFATNQRKFRLDEAALGDLERENLSHRTLPRDFARHPAAHHCWKIRVRGTDPVPCGPP